MQHCVLCTHKRILCRLAASKIFGLCIQWKLDKWHQDYDLNTVCVHSGGRKKCLVRGKWWIISSFQLKTLAWKVLKRCRLSPWLLRVSNRIPVICSSCTHTKCKWAETKGSTRTAAGESAQRSITPMLNSPWPEGHQTPTPNRLIFSLRDQWRHKFGFNDKNNLKQIYKW